jgi:hypothetical protein
MSIRKIIFLLIFLLISFNNSAVSGNTSLKETSHNKSGKKIQILVYKAIKNPSAIAINSKGEIFILGGKRNHYEIAVFNTSGKRLKTFRNINGGIEKPWAIFIGKKGNLWVASEEGKKGFISKISPEGKVLLKITNNIDFPYSIAFTESGDIVAADYGNGFDGYISEYNPKGIFLRSITKGIENPYSIITGNNGNIYAANYNKGNIVCLSKTGKLLWSSYKDISYPYSILLGKTGNIWVINDGPAQGSIVKYTAGGRVIKRITFGISYPYGAAVDKAGNIFVANFNNDTVSKFNEKGEFTGFAGNIRKPIGIAADEKGDIFVLNDGGYFTKITGNGGNGSVKMSGG